METPVELVFDGVDSSPDVEQRIRERLRRLERRFDGITSCHVAVGRPHRHRRHGERWNVRIEVRVPGTAFVTSRKPGDVAAHEDLLVAVRDAFDVIERELERWRTRRRAEAKSRRPAAPGRSEELDRAVGS